MKKKSWKKKWKKEESWKKNEKKYKKKERNALWITIVIHNNFGCRETVI